MKSMVEALMAARGVVLTCEAVRYWCRKFGQAYGNQLRHRRARPGDKWHVDEVFLTIGGEQHYLWGAMDQEGNILDIYRKNRAKNSHQPTRQRERRMQRFKSPGQAQRFLAAYRPITSHFRPRRYLFSVPEYRKKMAEQFRTWREITGTAMAA